MKKHRQEPEEQLNTASSAVTEPEETFSLEEIMREFGGWTKPEPEPHPDPIPEPEPEPQPAPIPEPEPEPEPQPEVMRVAGGPDRPDKPPVQFKNLEGDTIRFRIVTPEDLQEPEPQPAAEPVEMPEEPVVEPDRQARKAMERESQRLQKQERERRRSERAALRAKRREEPETAYPSPEDACAAYAKTGTLRIRLLICTVLTLLSGLLLVLGQFPLLGLDLTEHLKLLSVGTLGILLLQSVLSLDILLRGVYQALRLRFDLTSLLCLCLAVTLCDAFFAVAQRRMPLCTVVSLELLLALWSAGLEKKAKWRTLKTVLSMEQPTAAVRKESLWHGLDCIVRQNGNLKDFTAMLETPDAARKVMRVYAPIALVLTALLALLAAPRSSAGVLWAWSALLTASLPAGAFLCCSRPFSILAQRLHKAGAAICGWRGAKTLSGECGIVVTDNDLFPGKNITMSGMKLYSELSARQVVGYATAVVQAAGSGLLPLFEKLMESENGWRCSADSFRQYEGGGLGAEIRGDVVLMGSLPFMRLMGVYVPDNVKVQSAVYLSVNKELTAVFALSYAPSSATKNGLSAIMHSSGLAPIMATRDFMITPGLVKKRYKVSADRLEFPTVAERARLSHPDTGEGGKQGALMAGDSFASFAAAVSGGRQLRKTVHHAVIISLLSGILGMGLLAVLTYLDATQSASAANLLLYQLLWLLPAVLITGLFGKS